MRGETKRRGILASASGCVLCSGLAMQLLPDLPGFSYYCFLWFSSEQSVKWGKHLFFWASKRETSLSSCLDITLML